MRKRNCCNIGTIVFKPISLQRNGSVSARILDDLCVGMYRCHSSSTALTCVLVAMIFTILCGNHGLVRPVSACDVLVRH